MTRFESSAHPAFNRLTRTGPVASAGLLRRGVLAGAVAGVLAGSLLGGCASTDAAKAPSASASASAPVPAPAPAFVLPASARPVEAMAPLAFMTGRWMAVNPNGTLNEEHWMSVRGNHLLGTFRQVRRDGKPALIELSLITAEADGVKLRLRHLHTNLEVPERRKDVNVFTLVSAAGNRAEFAGTGSAEDVQSVVYELTAPNQLTMSVRFAPTSKEKGYSTVYTRE
jgi:hypothetical protein